MQFAVINFGRLQNPSLHRILQFIAPVPGLDQPRYTSEPIRDNVRLMIKTRHKHSMLLIVLMGMAVTLFSLNFLGDGLRDALDPQTRKM